MATMDNISSFFSKGTWEFYELHPRKMNMEAKYQPIEKEHHLPSIFGFQPLIFQGVSNQVLFVTGS